MYRLLLDTNVLLDAMEPGRPESNEACKVLERCNGGGDMGMACAMSLKDVYYVLCKLRGEALAREGVHMLMGLVVVAPTGAEEVDLAMRSNEPDFEDGLVRATAELNGVDFIITRDRSAFANTKVRSVSAAQYLKIVGDELHTS